MVYYIAYFFGGAFLANSIPHITNGMSGRPFPTPFATPPGQGESSSMLNVIWGALNIIIGYCLLFQLSDFNARSLLDLSTAGSGGLAIALYLSRRFGNVYGGIKAGSKKVDHS
ncbi:hypothetical protein [Solimicrobium silvestre]|uniref:Uncharacterized protein n=1 Tax=Solimicrobium silvestre TaxID=2099400 RepID=A0A2S9H447_9BURK|nr:hypothetical protein [Solimicrobium silvestre]PRC94703.1 hypothetical protein S2091_0706 [Solimicrobium silvestre]